MMILFKTIVMAMMIFILSACRVAPAQPLRISANLWIGYTPLFYAKERGWLEQSNIELVNVVSLYENMQMYAVGNADAFTGTQYEYHVQRQKHPSLVPVMLFDRSSGGDMVMSNRSLEALQKMSGPIDTYMEVDSVNSELFKAFVRYRGLDIKKFHIINLDPESISKLPMQKGPVVIVTYEPFDDTLRKVGYRTVADTRDRDLGFEIVDALYIDAKDKEKFKQQLQTLNRLIARALDVLQKDPRAYYDYVKYYLQGESYEDFLKSLKSIEWIYHRRDTQLLQQLKKQQVPPEYLMEPSRAI